ncbi:hypothetical protein U1Q18_039795 [Sarracenia purpurea var. burkii]
MKAVSSRPKNLVAERPKYKFPRSCKGEWVGLCGRIRAIQESKILFLRLSGSLGFISNQKKKKNVEFYTSDCDDSPLLSGGYLLLRQQSVGGKVAPIKSRHDKQLVSHDPKSNNYNYKYTFSVEICPICREDLICLPPKVAASLGNLGPLVICTKISNNIALLDPFTLRNCFLDADQYWRASFKSLLSSRQLVEYIVLDVELVSSEINVGGSKYVLAHAQVARVSDFGKNDTIFSVITHLGHLLESGDYALGYDLYRANTTDIELEKYKGLVLPDVILIKKSYEEKHRRECGKPRSWKLKSLNMEVDDTAKGRFDEDKMNSEYEQFLRDLEENPDMRFNVSLYWNKEYQASEMVSVTDDGEEVPSVPLEELLADLDLSDEEDGEESMKE